MLQLIQGRCNINIYVDMNVYYRPFDDQMQPRIELELKEIIFKLIEWQYKILWSYMLEFENDRTSSKEVTIKHNEQALKHILGSIKLINPVDIIGKELENDVNE